MRSTFLITLLSFSVSAQLDIGATYNNAYNSASSPAALYLAIANGLAPFQYSLPPLVFKTLTSTLASIPIPLLTASSVPVISAFNAAQLAANLASGTTVQQAQNCFNEIVNNPNSIYAGDFCADRSHDIFLTQQTMANTVLEQFVGIVPPVVFGAIQTALTGYFNSLIRVPGAQQMMVDINNSLISVVASASGDSVTAIERFQQCVQQSLVAGTDGNKSCFLGVNSPFTSINTLFAGVVQQFVGYLPPNLINEMTNNAQYFFSLPGLQKGLPAAQKITNVMQSVAASTSGSSVTYIQQIQYCLTVLIMDSAPASYNCVGAPGGPAFTLMVLINSYLQQAFGYLPPNLVLDLEAALAPSLASSPTPVARVARTAMNTAFTASGAGPLFVTCVEAFEDCIIAAINGATGPCNIAVGKCSPIKTPAATKSLL